MNIREAVIEDAAAISELIIESSRLYITPEFSSSAEEYFLKSMDEESIKSYMSQGYMYYVAELDHEIIAVIGIREFTHLYHLFVRKAFHGKGIAQTLWAEVKERCIVEKETNIFTVNSSNNAVGFYEKLGFARAEPMQNKNGILFNPMKLEIRHKFPSL